MGCNLQTSKDNRSVSGNRYSYRNWLTYIFLVAHFWSSSILQLKNACTPGLKKMTWLHTYLHPRTHIYRHTQTHRHTHTYTHTHTHRAEWSMKLWLNATGRLIVSPIWVSCKVHITDKMALMTHVRSHWLRLLNQTHCLWHWE